MMPLFQSKKSLRPSLLLTLLIIILGLGKLIFFIVGTSGQISKIFEPDSSSYINTALAFQETGQFAVSLEKLEIAQTQRTPGYPLFISTMLLLFSDYEGIIIAQILLSLGTIILTYFLVIQFWSPSIALLSAGLLSLDIPSFVNSQQILTDTLFTFLLTGSVLTGIYAFKKPSRVFFCLQSFLLACATLVRPISYYLIIPLLIIFLITWRNKLRWAFKKIFQVMIIFLLPWIIFIGGWQSRNYFSAGTAEFSTIQGVNLLFYRGAGIIALREGITFQEAQEMLGYRSYRELYPETASWSQAQLLEHWKHEGISLIQQHPGIFLHIQLHGLMKMILDPGDYMFWGYLENSHEQTGPLRDLFELLPGAYFKKWICERTGLFLFFAFAETYLLIIYTGTLFSLWQLQKHHNVPSSDIHIFLWSIIIYFFAISAGPEAYARFRIPIMPFLCVYAGHGIFHGAIVKLNKISFRRKTCQSSF